MHKQHAQIGVTALANGGVHSYPERRRLPLAYAVGICGYTVRLLLSLVFDLPSGALIVWLLALLAIPVYAVGAGQHSSSSDSEVVATSFLSFNKDKGPGLNLMSEETFVRTAVDWV